MFTYEDVVLLDTDIESLEDSRFLTDQVIEFYFKYLTYRNKNEDMNDDILLVGPSNSLLLANDTEEVIRFAKSKNFDTKRLVLFVINDCFEFDGSDSGSHWSILVYYRTMNAFLHFDSVKGANNIPAEKLYDAVKGHMGPGGQVSKPQTSKKKKDKKKSAQKGAQSVCKQLDVAHTAPAGLPIFMEREDAPQQSDQCACGLYVLAIAEVICENSTQNDIVSAITEQVDHSVEAGMRSKVLGVIQELSTK